MEKSNENQKGVLDTIRTIEESKLPKVPKDLPENLKPFVKKNLLVFAGENPAMEAEIARKRNEHSKVLVFDSRTANEILA
jgi:hypothetical protein